MPFQKYPSLVNHYRENEINRFKSKHVYFNCGKFVAQQKFDGANFQIIFDKPDDFDKFDDDIKVQFASRNILLAENDKFHDFRQIIKCDPYFSIIKNIKRYLSDRPLMTSINLYGEIYGKVFKRVNYFEPHEQAKNKIIFFDVSFNGTFQSPPFFEHWLHDMMPCLEPSRPCVEIFFTGSFEECMNIDVTELKTIYGSQIEGIVIKPYDVGDLDRIEQFFIKKKNEGFQEIGKESKSNEKPQLNENADVQKEFSKYLNWNRILCVASKESQTKFSTLKLTCLVLLDAIEDFTTDFPTVPFDDAIKISAQTDVEKNV